MPPIIWIAIAIAIVMLGIGGAHAIPQLPETVIRPAAEKGVVLLGPAMLGTGIALVLAGCFYAYLKLTGRGR